MLLTALLALLLTGLTVGLLAWALILPRARTAARVREIGAYGFAGGSAPATSASETSAAHSVSIVVGALGGAVARWTGGLKEETLRKELIAAGLYTISPRMIAGYRVIAALMGAGVGAMYELVPGTPGRIVTALALGYLGWRTPLVLVQRRARARLEAIDRKLPDLIDMLVVTIEAGVGFAGSLQIAAGRIDGPLGDELRLTLQEQRMGRDLGDSLTRMLQRADGPSMRSFVRAVVQGESLGVSVGQIMRGLALEMRKRRRSSAEERAQKAPVKMLFPLIFLIFPALGIVLLGPAAFEMLDAFSNL